MHSETLKFVLQEFAERPLPTGLGRELSLPTDTNKVIGLCGVRRTGKTFLFYEAMGRLLERGVPRQRIVYLNFEDDRLQPIEPSELDLVLRCQRELFAAARQGRLYLFLDEVQNAPGWERWVRRLHDSEDISIFVTGSSSALLTRDLSTAMRGRSITVDVFPLSFREFLSFRRIEVRQHDARSVAEVRAALSDYLQEGGFPEVVRAEPAMRPLILDEYASLMLWRDLVERHQIRNEALMRALLRHCFRNTASLLSGSKLHRDLQSQGLAFSRQTLATYIELLQDAGLVFLMPIRSESVRKQAHNPRKLHVVDTGLINAFKAGAARDFGHKLETAVFLQARRHRRAWHWLAGASEVDLVDADGTRCLNSCWRLVDHETVQRERASVAFARRELPEADVGVVYHDALHDIQDTLPEAVPAWQWLLAQPVLRFPDAPTGS